jgi:hypothetical protein
LLGAGFRGGRAMGVLDVGNNTLSLESAWGKRSPFVAKWELRGMVVLVSLGLTRAGCHELYSWRHSRAHVSGQSSESKTQNRFPFASQTLPFDGVPCPWVVDTVFLMRGRVPSPEAVCEKTYDSTSSSCLLVQVGSELFATARSGGVIKG